MLLVAKKQNFFYICTNKQGRFYKLALTDCEAIFVVNLFVSEGV